MMEQEKQTEPRGASLMKMVYYCMVLSFYNVVLSACILFAYFTGSTVFGLIGFVLITSWGAAYWRKWSKRIRPLI